MLTELPWEMGNMNELKTLDLSHNPLVIPPRVIIQQGTESVIKWIKTNEKEGRKGKVSGLGIQSEEQQQQQGGKKK